MNAPDTTYKKGRENPSRLHLHYLERQQRDLMALSRQLNSYQCVPKTEILHEQMERIRTALNRLVKENASLINSFRESSESAQQHFDSCETQFQKMLRLEREVLTYIGKARVHG
ncbi:hypothetical protein SAMN06265375_103313 [Muriicola jejuensis]|nr:hypothetical protein SAMN06265375_103313 [Muriicola jejuensis]